MHAVQYLHSRRVKSTQYLLFSTLGEEFSHCRRVTILIFIKENPDMNLFITLTQYSHVAINASDVTTLFKRVCVCLFEESRQRKLYRVCNHNKHMASFTLIGQGVVMISDCPTTGTVSLSSQSWPTLTKLARYITMKFNSQDIYYITNRMIISLTPPRTSPPPPSATAGLTSRTWEKET